MPLSLTAFADADLEAGLLDTARSAGTRLFVPHGAVVGLDALEEGRETWDEVGMVMKKPVRSLDFSSAAGIDPEAITAETTLFDGTAREICPLYPRNVNSHAAVALAGIGFDRTRSVLIADPALEASIIEVEARGGGVEISIRRGEPDDGRQRRDDADVDPGQHRPRQGGCAGAAGLLITGFRSAVLARRHQPESKSSAKAGGGCIHCRKLALTWPQLLDSTVLPKSSTMGRSKDPVAKEIAVSVPLRGGGAAPTARPCCGRHGRSRRCRRRRRPFR